MPTWTRTTGSATSQTSSLPTGTLTGASAEALIEAAERILGEAGCEHRLIIVRDERWAERHAPAFNALGFSTSREVTMTHRRDPDRYANLPVEMVPFAVVRPLIEEMYREDPDVPDDLSTIFTEQHGKYERVGEARFFTPDGRLGRADGVSPLGPSRPRRTAPRCESQLPIPRRRAWTGAPPGSSRP